MASPSLTSAFLWVPPTSWLRPEASYPGSLWTQPAAGDRRRGLDEKQPWGRSTPVVLSLDHGSPSAMLRPWGRSGLLGLVDRFHSSGEERALLAHS